MKYIKYIVVIIIFGFSVGQWASGESKVITKVKYPMPPQPDFGIGKMGQLSDEQSKSILRAYQDRQQAWNNLTLEQKNETITENSGSSFIPLWSSITLVLVSSMIGILFIIFDIINHKEIHDIYNRGYNDY